jgi:hypothetical protein
VACILEFQPSERVELIAIQPDAMRAQENAYQRLLAGDCPAVFAACDLADSLEPDPRAVVFHGDNLGLRAAALETSMQGAAAVREARRALVLNPHNCNTRIVLASEALEHGELDGANLQIDSLLSEDPVSQRGSTCGVWSSPLGLPGSDRLRGLPSPASEPRRAFGRLHSSRESGPGETDPRRTSCGQAGFADEPACSRAIRKIPTSASGTRPGKNSGDSTPTAFTNFQF